jgi:hypothetical protein
MTMHAIMHTKRLHELFSIPIFWRSIEQYKDLRNVLHAVDLSFLDKSTKDQIESSWCLYFYTQETNILTTKEDAIKDYQNLSIEKWNWTIWECYGNEEDTDCVIEELEYGSWFAMKESLKDFAKDAGDWITYMVWRTIPNDDHYGRWRIDTVWKWKTNQVRDFIAFPKESSSKEHDWWTKEIVKQIETHHRPMLQLTSGNIIFSIYLYRSDSSHGSDSIRLVLNISTVE